jgi:hypothetical protein
MVRWKLVEFRVDVSFRVWLAWFLEFIGYLPGCSLGSMWAFGWAVLLAGECPGVL